MSYRARRSYGARPRYGGRSRSARRPMRPVQSMIKRARTRAYANLRTGGLLAIERKFSDCASSVFTVGTPGAGVATGVVSTFAPPVITMAVYRDAIGTIRSPISWSALNILGIGDSGCDRDGRQVINDSIHIRGFVEFSDSGLGTINAGSVVNVAVVLDTQTNGAGPTGGQVFVNPGDFTSTGFAGGASPFLNLSNSKRFRILKHVRRYISPTSLSASANVAQGGFLVAMDIPLKGMKTNYVSDATTGYSATVSCIGDNGIFLFVWSDVANNLAAQFNSRLRFRG